MKNSILLLSISLSGCSANDENDKRQTEYAEINQEIQDESEDMDYCLLRYGPEDVGKYTQDGSVVAKYYGVLNVYADLKGTK